MKSTIVFITLCLGITSAAVWRGCNPEKPKEFEDQEGCYVKEINEVIPFGATVEPIGVCVRIQCGQMIEYASCGTVGTGDDNCYVTEEDLTQAYPECCPGIKCIEDNKIQ